MSTRKMVAVLTKMNNALVHFLVATEADKHTKEEKAEQMKWAVPHHCCDEFDKKRMHPDRSFNEEIHGRGRDC